MPKIPIESNPIYKTYINFFGHKKNPDLDSFVEVNEKREIVIIPEWWTKNNREKEFMYWHIFLNHFVSFVTFHLETSIDDEPENTKIAGLRHVAVELKDINVINNFLSFVKKFFKRNNIFSYSDDFFVSKKVGVSMNGDLDIAYKTTSSERIDNNLLFSKEIILKTPSIIVENIDGQFNYEDFYNWAVTNLHSLMFIDEEVETELRDFLINYAPNSEEVARIKFVKPTHFGQNFLSHILGRNKIKDNDKDRDVKTEESFFEPLVNYKEEALFGFIGLVATLVGLVNVEKQDPEFLAVLKTLSGPAVTTIIYLISSYFQSPKITK